MYNNNSNKLNNSLQLSKKINKLIVYIKYIVCVFIFQMVENMGTLYVWQIWFFVAIFLFALEMITGTFVLLFLGIACTGAAICAAFNLSSSVQWLTFCLVSLVTILLFLKHKFLNNKDKEDESQKVANSARLIGKVGVITEEIPEFGKGSVLVDNETWMAVSDTQEKIEVNKKVTIKDIQGVKLIVSKNI